MIDYKHQEGRRNAISKWSKILLRYLLAEALRFTVRFRNDQFLWPCIRVALMTPPHQKISKKLTHGKTSCEPEMGKLNASLSDAYG